ncbi:T9SS type A sorting domain-containing protein [Alkaliflexus imshenetskii]|uniref:T9SS type A sorting domain-containing protein n=1 Tax=Alkaliflexus imshenetskii TaxID=286730 RepID=UPI0004BB1CEE|nr:T9SS type A sorting domain-containing protein [Alkaliflexus imshenetskii]
MINFATTNLFSADKRYYVASLFFTLFAVFAMPSLMVGQGDMKVETFTTPGNGTWTVPAGVTQITVEAWGGGGGGGGSNSNNNGGSGGGGGGYATYTITVTPGQSIPYTVGAGGSGGAANNSFAGNGGNSAILSLTANGGTGGRGNAGAAGVGGEGSGGIDNASGANGVQGGNSGGNGGNGANGGTGGLGNTDGNGGNGDAPGGGGGGGERNNGFFGIGASNHTGGAGASGQIRISYVPAYRAEFISMNTGSDIWETGETRSVSVTVRNTGQATWTNSNPDVNIGVKWNADSDYQIRVDADNLAPGESRTYELAVTAPMAIGTNNLTFDVVNEGACWFGSNLNVCGPGNAVFRSTDITIAPVINRYYSYQSGDWNSANTWTQDPSGTLSVNPAVPGQYDFVTILNGRDVFIPNNNKSVFSLEIQNGGTLDLRTSTGHNFGIVRGEGTLRLQTNNFPGGNFDVFTTAGGGTVEYYNPAANFTLQQLEYNNLTFNFAVATRTATLAGNLNINGNLNITRGRFQIGNNAIARTIQINGNVLVDNNGRIQIGTNDTNHRFIVNGDFTNYGVVRFTNQDAPNYTVVPNNGRADVVFNNPTANQNLYLAGQSDFYRIEIDKGIDQTFVLNIDATATGNFRLFGINNVVPGTNAPNINNPHALGLLTGTVRLGQNIVIPSLATGTTYTVDEDAMLWLDGANVTFGDGTTSDGTTLLLYGALKVSGNSILNDNSKQGIVSRATAAIIIEGGEITTECVRTSYQTGVHRGAFNMSGGELTVRAVNLPNLGGMDVYPAFTLPYPDNTVNISGGVINILSPNLLGNSSGTNFSLLIGANPNNVSITGGEINITVPNNRNAFILSTAPLWDLNIISTSNNNSAQPRAYANNATIPGIAVQPLVVKNNLTLVNRGVLTSGNANADVIVGGNFTINNNTTYTPGTNTTIFNGNGPQTFTNSGTLTDGFNNLELVGKSDLTLNGAATFAVRGSLTLGKETILRDNGRVITVAGNINNSGTHFRPVSGAGRIELTGGAAQLLSGDGNGVFNNLSVNKSGGSVTMDATMAVNGDLRLVSNHRFAIGNNLLKLGADANIYSAATGTAQTFNNNKMIVTGGLMSNGGVQKQFSNTDAFLYPFGFAIGTTNYYMPATVRFSAVPTQWGAVTSRPVNGRHHLAQGTNNALTTYWKTTSSGFTGIPANSVVHTYSYTDAFVQGNENNYIPAVYNYGTAWRTINDVNLVNQATNVITFNAESNANGEYTAGLPAAFTGIPVLYSRTTGNWNQAATWSTTGHDGGAGSITPNANTIVVIGEGHTVTMTANGATAGALFIKEGAILDLQNFNNHNFAALPEETVTGSGTLRIASTNYFPQGDFGDFIGPNGGTVEYYTTAADVVVPTSSSGTGLALNRYYNLVLNVSAGRTITLPDTDVEVLNNLTIKGSNIVQTRNGGTSRSYQVNKNLNIESGTLQYRNGVVTNIRVLGNLEISSGASFNVLNGGTAVANTLEIYGNLINNGTFNMVGSTRNTATYFKGEQNASIEGSGATFNFHSLFVDKGSDATPVLTLKSTITTGITNPFLILLNGTFRVDREGLVVTVTDGTTNFSIPSTAALSVNAGTVRVAYGNNNANLLLAGKLEVLGGLMEIGQSTQNQNNSIEYAAAGKPEIFVSGGTLYVNGQVRRPSTTTSGSLNYIQTGGEVIIAGRNRMAARGLLEVVNAGSLFSTSGGTLTLVRPSAVGTTFGDLYLRPEAHNVTGGTIQLGATGNTAGYSFAVQSSAPVWNITIGANTGQAASLAVLPLVVKNALSISNNSLFMANGLDVEIAGSLINNNISSNRGVNEGGFRPGTATQVTRFNGTGSQTIQGVGTNVTNFANLEVRSANLTLAANSALFVNNNLSLFSGVFNDGGNIVAVSRNIHNVATHVSGSATGGISVEGTQAQTISGNNAVFGNILMNNSNGAIVVNNMRINGRLTFTAGSLYVNDYLLTFGESATIGGTPNNKQMVMLNGVLSDQGVRKLFNAGASPEFVFPIGVQGKYTPAAYTILANSAAGSITLRPINEKHAAVNDAVANELAYYWSVKSEGFGGLSVNHRYTYVQDDVNADELQYVGGRYDYENYTWYNLGSVVNAADNTINFTADYITGEYTVGYAPNFVTKPVLYSRQTGNWNNGNTWSLTQGGAASGLTPNGNPVIIATGHTVTLNSNSAYSYSVEINGTLDAGTTLYHNLGHIFGIGTLALNSTSEGIFVLPGGRFDDFFDNVSTTIEFRGNNAANLPLKPGNVYKPYQNVILSGTGAKNISAEDMKINGNLIIRNGTVLNNSNYNRTIYVGGDWINQNTSAGGFIAGRGTVVFDGNRTQKFNVRVTENFYNVTMNTTGVVDMAESANNAALAVSNRLSLSRGIIRSYDNKVVHVTNTAADAVAGGNANAYVDGPLTKRIFSGQSFTFQVGNDGRYGRMAVLNTQGGASPADWTVKYVNENPYPRNEANLNTPITSVSNNEHWLVSRPTGASANIQLRWDDYSYPGVTSDASLRNRLRVVQYNNADTKWSERGQTVNASAKTVATANRVTTNDYIFTLGLSGVTATISDFTQVEICNNGSVASIPVTLTGTAPWTLSYRVTGPVTRNFTQTGITSPNYVIQLTGADLAGAGNYSVSLVSVSDNSAAGIANAGSVNLVVQQAFVPVISGAAMVGRSEVRTYSTPQNGANTYTWSWVGAAGGTIATPNAASTNITFGTTNGTYQLQVTETTTATGCQVSTVFAIEVTDIPVPDINPKEPNICIGTTVTYTTAAITNNQYLWTVTGGTIQTAGATNWRTIAANGNSITVVWNTAGNGSVKVEERVGTTSVQGETTENIVVSPAINGRIVSVEDAQVCDGTGTFIRVAASELNVSYRLRDQNGIYRGPSVGGTGADLLLPTGDLSHGQSPYTFTVVAFNLACEIELANKPQVIVNPQPVVNLISDAEGGLFCLGTQVAFEATPGLSSYTFRVNGVDVLTGTSNLFASSSLTGGSEITVRAANAQGCVATSAAIVLNANTSNGIWTGVVNSEINNPANWCNGSVPAMSNLVISSKMIHQPHLNDEVTITNLTIEPNASVAINGGAKVTLNGVLNNSGELVLNNSYLVNGMASFIHNGSQTGSGVARVNLTLPKEQWFYLGSSIQNPTFGNFSPGANGSGTFINVYRDKWYSTYTQHSNTALRPLEGVAVYYVLPVGETLKSLSYTGVLNSGPITRTFIENRYQLMANPYPSFIDWQNHAGWERANFEPTIWYRAKVGEAMAFVTYNWDADEGARVALFPDGSSTFNEDEMARIAPMQSVFVRPRVANAQITLNNSTRAHGYATSRLKSGSSGNSDVVRIVADNGVSRDGAVIYFSARSTEGIDTGDSEKYRNDDNRVPEIYTKVGGRELAINGMPELVAANRTIPLSVRNRQTGEVTLTFDMSYFNGMHSVYLEDRDTGAYSNITRGGSYSYTVTETGERDDRFMLHFYQVSTRIEPDMEDGRTSAGINILSMNGKVLVSFTPELLQQGEGIIELYTIEGRKVSETTARNSRTIIMLPRESGVYIVRAAAGGAVKSERVIGNSR